MEINIPTASPFFTGIPNQIMYCISTPNLPTWNAGNAYSNEQQQQQQQQKKPENSSIIQPVGNSQNAQNQTAAQYYYGNSNAQAIAQNIQAFNQSYPPANIQQTTSNGAAKTNSGNYTDNNDQNKNQQQQERENRFFNEDGRAYECAVCQKKFRQKGTLVQHERIHLDLKPYSCPHCDKRFRQKAILNQHTRIHSDASSQLVYRNLGNNSGTLWPQNVPYPDEIRSEKNNEAKEAIPHISHSVFGSPQDVNNREDSRNGKNSMPLYVRCPICQQEFKQKSTLVQRGCIHIESRPYSCLVINCGKRFRQQSHLQQHNRIHLNLKPYQCPYQDCQKFFRQQTILNQHIRVHNGTKPYRCKTCFKEFRQQAILSQHEKSHMSSTLGCPLTNCKRRFVTENDLRKHIEQHMNPPKPKKPSTAKSSDFKPEIPFAHHQAYPPLYFNPPAIHQPKN